MSLEICPDLMVKLISRGQRLSVNCDWHRQMIEFRISKRDKANGMKFSEGYMTTRMDVMDSHHLAHALEAASQSVRNKAEQHRAVLLLESFKDAEDR